MNKTLAQIIDETTKELSKAINVIWNQETLKENLERIKNNPEVGKIKEHIDEAQSILLELLTYLEQFEKQLAIGFYMFDNL